MGDDLWEEFMAEMQARQKLIYKIFENTRSGVRTYATLHAINGLLYKFDHEIVSSLVDKAAEDAKDEGAQGKQEGGAGQ